MGSQLRRSLSPRDNKQDDKNNSDQPNSKSNSARNSNGESAGNAAGNSGGNSNGNSGGNSNGNSGGNSNGNSGGNSNGNSGASSNGNSGNPNAGPERGQTTAIIANPNPSPTTTILANPNPSQTTATPASNAAPRAPSSFAIGGSSTFESCLYCVAGIDPRVLYSAGWFTSSPQVGDSLRTTNTTGSSLTFRFNGSGVIVFGTAQGGVPFGQSPSISFSLPPTTYTNNLFPFTINQPLFASPVLVGDEHELTIKVSVPRGASFSINYFFVYPHSAALNQSSIDPDAVGAGSNVRLPGQRELTAAVGILAALVVLLLMISGLLVCKLLSVQRRVKKGLVTANDNCPYKTQFTTTESILQGTSMVFFPESRSMSTYSLPRTSTYSMCVPPPLPAKPLPNSS